MSVEAMNHALSKAVDAMGLTPSQRFVLLLLSNNANQDGQCWPGVAYLAEKTGLSRRGVQLALDDLSSEPLNLIIRAERKHEKNNGNTSNLYTLCLPGVPTPAKSVRPPRELTSPPQANSVRPEGEVSSPLTTLEPKGEPVGADAPTAGVRKIGRDRLVEAWRVASPGRLSPGRVDAAFAEASRICDPLAIAAAGERYLAEDPDVRRLGTAISLHTWLDERRFEAWATDPSRPPPAPPRAVAHWAGPPEIRLGLVAVKGEDFAASYLDPSGWDPARRALLPATGVAADTLRHLGARLLAQIGVDDVDPPTRNLFGDRS